MENYIIPRSYVFKLKCPKCQKKMKKLLSRLNGVYSIKIEVEGGRVSVKSTVHPNILASVLGEAMTEQDLTCQEQPVTCGYETPEKHELAKTQRLRHLEFTQTRSLRMTLNGGPSQEAHSDKGPSPEPKKPDDPSDFGGSPPHTPSGGSDDFGDSASHYTGALPQEPSGSSSTASHSDCGVCPSHCAGSVVTYSRPYFTPSSYHHHHRMPPPYHGYFYPPPPYRCHPAVAPPPEKASCADLSCENMSRCRMM